MPILKRVEIRRRGGTNTNSWFQYFEPEVYNSDMYDDTNFEIIGTPTDEEVTYPTSPVVPIEPSGDGAGATRVADIAERDSLDTSNFINGHRVIYPNGDVEYWYDDSWSTDAGIGDLQIQ